VKPKAILLLAAAAALLTGCGSKGTVYEYECEGGGRFRVTISEDKAVLELDDQKLELEHMLSGSGAKYSDGKTIFWTIEDEALIEVDGEIVRRDCRLVS
jgi:membrane-bound inhibitor of C-type lysozyme